MWEIDYKFVEFLTAGRDGGQVIGRLCCCPCCDLPTLGEPGAYEICGVCSWEDDGSLGYGPNAVSLETGRAYFGLYLTSYAPTHEYSPQYQAPGRRFIHDQLMQPAALEARQRRVAELRAWMEEPDLGRRTERMPDVFEWARRSQ